jgi:flagellar biosynthesis/type III secretory pathway protein FliH
LRDRGRRTEFEANPSYLSNLLSQGGKERERDKGREEREEGREKGKEEGRKEGGKEGGKGRHNFPPSILLSNPCHHLADFSDYTALPSCPPFRWLMSQALGCMQQA